MSKSSLKTDKGAAKVLRILEHLAQADRPVGVAELASALRLSKSSVHRPLTTLVELGYVRQETLTARYAASLKMWEVGSAVLDRLDLKRVAAEPMTELAGKTRETVHLSILDGKHVVHIDKIECEHAIRAYSRRTRARALHRHRKSHAGVPVGSIHQDGDAQPQARDARDCRRSRFSFD
jgi:DNA-binding IclR family transcriptional regulator